MLKLFIGIPHKEQCNIKSDGYWNNSTLEIEISVIKINNEIMDIIEPKNKKN